MRFVTGVEKKWHGHERVDLKILRAELATPAAVGNKHFKLSGNLDRLVQRGCMSVLSFGGAWSNHLHALSVEGKRRGVEVVAIVRGDAGVSNPMLESAQNHGTHVVMISRSEYRQRHNPDYCERLCAEHGCDAWLPEGGSNDLAVEGCEKLLSLDDTNDPPDVIALAVGTGATMAGVIKAAHDGQTVIGLPVVNDESVQDKITDWVQQSNTTGVRWHLTDPLQPRYGTADQSLIEFILKFFDETGVALDPVYTGKALLQVLSPAFMNTLASESTVQFIHTGGLMGAYGFYDNFRKRGDSEIADRYFSAIRQLTD